MISYLSIIILSFLVASAPAERRDWPQWQGPDRTNVSTETGLLKSWPPSGPPVSWSVANLGVGYGSVAIKGDRIYVQGTRGNKESVVHALSRSDGSNVWVRSLGSTMLQERGGGPRGTPTVDGNRLYALSESGDLACLSVEDGSIVWKRNILKDFSGRNIEWLISESPLVDGDRVIVSPGGTNAGIVALDKMTGKTVWKSQELSDPAAYSSCTAGDIFGTRVIAALNSQAAVGVRASDGKLLWRYAKVSNNTANITTPIISGNRIFYTSGYGTGCVLLEFTDDGKNIGLKDVYFSRAMQNHHGGVVLVDGNVYGFSDSILTCMNFDTGKTVWKNRAVGKGSLTCADGHLYILSENQVVGLVEASPAGYVEKGRFKIKDEGWPSWAHPVVCDGRLYIRNQGTLTAYNIRPEAK